MTKPGKGYLSGIETSLERAKASRTHRKVRGDVRCDFMVPEGIADKIKEIQKLRAGLTNKRALFIALVKEESKRIYARRYQKREKLPNGLNVVIQDYWSEKDE